MNVLILRTWIAFKSIIQKFLGNHRSGDYKNLVDEIMDCMERLGYKMSIGMHFLRSHLNYIPCSCGYFIVLRRIIVLKESAFSRI